MSTVPVRELIVYRLRDDRLEAFEAIKQQMISESLTLEGLQSSTTARVLGEKDVYADTMIWTSQEAAETALPVFKRLPTAPSFLGMFDGPPLQHLVLEYQPDQVG